MTLKKLTNDHYVIVDDSEIKEGDLVFNEYQKQIKKFHAGSGIGFCRKITHSTQPLEYSSKIGKYWGRVQPIELSEVKELIGVVDKAFERYPIIENDKEHNDRNYYRRSAYYQAIEDNKEKKYTEEDLRKAYYYGKSMMTPQNFEKFIKSLQPKTEWEVEFVNGKLKLK